MQISHDIPCGLDWRVVAKLARMAWAIYRGMDRRVPALLRVTHVLTRKGQNETWAKSHHALVTLWINPRLTQHQHVHGFLHGLLGREPAVAEDMRIAEELGVDGSLLIKASVARRPRPRAVRLRDSHRGRTVSNGTTAAQESVHGSAWYVLERDGGLWCACGNRDGHHGFVPGMLVHESGVVKFDRKDDALREARRIVAHGAPGRRRLQIRVVCCRRIVERQTVARVAQP
jgi:hypothetical protein